MYEPVPSIEAKQAERTWDNPMDAFENIFKDMNDYLYYKANDDFKVSSDPFKVMGNEPTMVAPFRFQTTTPDEMLVRLQMQFALMLKKKLEGNQKFEEFLKMRPSQLLLTIPYPS
tara:strand:- start:1771 stop:2115 length:345 start_codon:yes stop_codon:yes gene_type:complete